MISAGVDGRLPYMTYPEPWRGPPKPSTAEFLRPAPKPLPSNRYNGVASTCPNGTRLAPPPLRSASKFPSPPSTITTPVNLTQHKEEILDDVQYGAYSRLYPHTTHFTHFSPYSTLYPTPYAHMIRPNNFVQPPLSPLEPYSPTTPTGTTSSTFLSPSYSPPSALKTNQLLLREKRTPPHIPQQPPTPPGQAAFKVPSGKEGSMKHRILTSSRPEDASPTGGGPLDLQKMIETVVPRKRLVATMSPPRSPKRFLNNNSVAGSFAAGSLIQLSNGELKKIEDMRTEDFVISAEKNPELRLADSTVVKIEENNVTGAAIITLSYNQRRTQVDVESLADHPYFVYGQGWASCKPEKTLQTYKLKVHRLQVGDVLISLTPREPNSHFSSRTPTIMTTATTTSMTARQVSTTSNSTNATESSSNTAIQNQPLNLHNSMSPESMAARKRRWSAPDQICEEDDLNARKLRGE